MTRRVAIVAAVVAAWIALGLALELDANRYLLLGIPLTAAFQVLVARRPVRALWARDAPPWRWTGVLLAVAVAPGLAALRTIAGGAAAGDGVIVLYGAAALGGALAAGYAAANLGAKEARAGAAPAALAVLLGCAAMLANSRHRPDVGLGVFSLLQYAAATFVVEEVSFRGAFDAYIEEAAPHWSSAFAAALLWGAWHLPTLPRAGRTPQALLALCGFHAAIGVPLALSWRRSRNLALPAFAHALIDAVRNSVIG